MKPTLSPQWYVLRATYGREKKAYEYLVSQGVNAFYPTIKSVKLIGGKRKRILESRLPNILFAYGTLEQIKAFVFDNVNLPYLRFYYRHFNTTLNAKKEPLVIPDNQMESLKIICEAEADDIIVSSDAIRKFEEGQLVRIIDGAFKGVVGHVARYMGQQRVGIVIDGDLLVTTAYVPSGFIREITDNESPRQECART